MTCTDRAGQSVGVKIRELKPLDACNVHAINLLKKRQASNKALAAFVTPMDVLGDNVICYKMRYIHGDTLFKYLKTNFVSAQKNFTGDLLTEMVYDAVGNRKINHRVVDVLRQIIKSLTVLWSNGFFHNDLKSDNILVDFNNRVWFIDLDGLTYNPEFDSKTSLKSTKVKCEKVAARAGTCTEGSRLKNKSDARHLGIECLYYLVKNSTNNPNAEQDYYAGIVGMLRENSSSNGRNERVSGASRGG